MRGPGTDPLTPDLCILGAGSGGLSVAAGAVQMGASVVLIEKAEMGGDCLNVGCVPSKALIEAAAHAQGMRDGAAFGVTPVEPEIDHARAMAHVRETIAAIAPHDSQERFEGLGCTVIRAEARFTSDREIEAGGIRIRPRRFVIATGSRPAVPPVPGLDGVPYLTNETLWGLDALPRHLAILGGGPIGLEMAQAHRRLGAQVTVIEAATALGTAEPEIARIAMDRLRAEGVDLREGVRVEAAERAGDGVALTLSDGGRVEASHLLVATGRKPTTDGLDLEAAGIEHGPQGITVDRGLRTTNRRAYAIGDVAAGHPNFTHAAGYHAGLVVRSALLRLPVRARTDLIPAVTYTDPAVAQIGLTASQAREIHGDRIEVHRAPLAENDRARAARRTEGMMLLVADRRERILGVSVVAPHAGELIQPWALAISKGLRLRDISGHVAAYPTFGEVSKRAAGAYFAPRLFESAIVKRIVRLLARLP